MASVPNQLRNLLKEAILSDREFWTDRIGTCGGRYGAELQLVHGPQVYTADAVEVRSDQLIVEIEAALEPGSTVSLIGDLHGLDLRMELRSGAKVAHCRPCGEGCYQVGLWLAWSDLEVHRPSDTDEPELDRRSAARLH